MHIHPHMHAGHPGNIRLKSLQGTFHTWNVLNKIFFISSCLACVVEILQLEMLNLAGILRALEDYFSWDVPVQPPLGFDLVKLKKEICRHPQRNSKSYLKIYRKSLSRFSFPNEPQCLVPFYCRQKQDYQCSDSTLDLLWGLQLECLSNLHGGLVSNTLKASDRGNNGKCKWRKRLHPP